MNVRHLLACIAAVATPLLVNSLPAAVIEGHWTFDQVGGTTAIDGSGNSRDAALQNSAAMVAGGQLGGALSLNSATSDHARVTGYPGVTGTAARSISAWIRPSGAAANLGIISWGTNTSNQRYTLRTDPAAGGVGAPPGRLRVEFSGGARHDNVAAPDLFDGGWHHVAVTMPDPPGNRRNNHVLYIDGVAVATQDSGGNSTINTNALSDVLIGARTLAANTPEIPFNGQIDDTAIFSQELTGPEIAAIFNLAVEEELEYNVGQANELLSVHEAGSGSVLIDGTLWEFATGLNTGLGQVVAQNGGFSLQLDASGTGVFGTAVPEPASVAMWMLLGVAFAGFAYRRVRR